MGCRDPLILALRWAATADLATMQAKAPSLGLSAKFIEQLDARRKTAPHAAMMRALMTQFTCEAGTAKVHALTKAQKDASTKDAKRKLRAQLERARREHANDVAAAPDRNTFVKQHFGVDAEPCAKTAAALKAVAAARSGSPVEPKVHYVIAVIGLGAPLEAWQAKVLRELGSREAGGTVQLLWAPLPTALPTVSKEESATKSRRTRLAGYYPILVSVAEPPELAALPAPRVPPTAECKGDAR
jgi:hypothetical protein